MPSHTRGEHLAQSMGSLRILVGSVARRFKSSGVYAPAGEGSGAQTGSEDIIITFVKAIPVYETMRLKEDFIIWG